MAMSFRRSKLQLISQLLILSIVVMIIPIQSGYTYYTCVYNGNGNYCSSGCCYVNYDSSYNYYYGCGSSSSCSSSSGSSSSSSSSSSSTSNNSYATSATLYIVYLALYITIPVLCLIMTIIGIVCAIKSYRKRKSQREQLFAAQQQASNLNMIPQPPSHHY